MQQFLTVASTTAAVLVGGSPLSAQERPHAPGGGIQVSPILSYQLPSGSLGYGMQLEFKKSTPLVPLLQLTRWRFDGGCNLLGPCYTSGWSAEVGLHYAFRSSSDFLQPYLGFAGGRIELEEEYSDRAYQRWVYSAQGGLDLRLTSRVALRIESRVSIPHALREHQVRYASGSAGLRVHPF